MNYSEIKEGMLVDYHIDRMDRVVRNCIVTHEPWFMDMHWVCKISGFDRCVKCARLSPAKRL